MAGEPNIIRASGVRFRTASTDDKGWYGNLKVTRELLERIVDGLNLGIVFVDKDNTIVVFNRKAGEMLRQDPRERVGSSIFLCHPEKSVPGVRKLIEELKTGVKHVHESWVNFGGRILYESIYPAYDEEGNYVGMFDIWQDAADKAELLKRLGMWKELPVHGTGDRAPRRPKQRALQDFSKTSA